jgi:uncharacterized protein
VLSVTEPRPSAAAPHPLVAALGLEPHPEGGWYRQTWRTEAELAAHGGVRAAATGIHFLLQPGESSAWHRVASDELWLWQGGGQLRLRLGGSAERPATSTADADADVEAVVLGPDPLAGDALQVLVPAGVWQAAEPVGASHVLVACVVAPGFDFADFELLDVSQ